MSTIAIISILVALILGGVIAALGDRIGTKVGKARLRIFNLRPKQTAILVTVMTGTLISASTLGVLLASSEPLRQGLFDLDRIKRDLRIAKDQLNDAKREKETIEEVLESARTEQETVQNRLDKINANFDRAKNQLTSVSGQAKQLRSDIQVLLKDRGQLEQQKQQLDGQITSLQSEIRKQDLELQQQEQKAAQQDQILQQRQQKLTLLEKQLNDLQGQQKKLQGEINQRDQKIATLDRQIAAKDKSLQERENQFKELESQRAFLQRQVTILEEYYRTYQDLRERQIAILRGQLLAFGAFRIVETDTIIPAIDELLRQANRNAIRAITEQNGTIDPSERVVKITKAQVEQLVQQLEQKGDYVVRILSAGNYVQGEREVRVFADVVPNEQIFQQNNMIAKVSIDPESRQEEDIEQRLDILLSAARFRARRSGVIGPIQVEDGQIKTLITFIEQVSQSEEIIEEIQAIAAEDTYTIGPLKLRLLAINQGEIVFSSQEIEKES
ncbi:MAG: DUF3084 domain-containing protein [Microcystaceae cyanobacterium]